MNVFLKLSLFFLLILNTSTFANSKKFKVSYDPDYAPFSYLEKNKPQGLLIDYWRLWAEKNNYKIEFVNGKLWDNAIDLVKKEKVDFFLGTYPYEKWMKSSKTYYSTKTSLFIHKENSRGYSKNAAYIIAIIGSDYKEHIQKHFPNSQILIFEDYKSVFTSLINREVDLIYDDKIAIEFYALRNDNFHEIRSIELLNDNPDIKAIAADEELINIFNKGLEKLSKNDLYDIESKWILNKNERYYRDKSVHLTEEEEDFIKNNIIKVSASKSWRPFNFNKNNNPNGIAYDFWEIISNKTGIKSSYSFYSSFTDQLESIKHKSHDIIYSVGETKERKKYALFSKPFYMFPISIATLKDENFIEDISYILDKKIAVGKNFTAHKILKERYPEIDFILVKNISEGLNAVTNQEAFAYVDVKPILEYNIKKFDFNDIKISGNTGLKYNLSIMIRDDYHILQSIINKTIDTLEKEEIVSIISKWENVHFEKTFDYLILWIILLISLLLILFSVYKEYLTSKENKKLETLVNERTKDLKKLTQSLEQIVEEKTKELKKVNYILDEAQKMAKLGSFQYNIKKDILIFSDEFYKILNLDKNTNIPSFEIALKYVHDEDKEKVSKLLEKSIKSKKSVNMEFRLVLEDKIKYIQSTSKITKFDNNNEPVLFICTILDLTKIKNLENEKREKESILAQQSKMAALGEMLENIAHQWRQPLSVISTASTGLQLNLEYNKNTPKEHFMESIKTINNQAQYLSKTIDDFRNFFNPNKIKSTFDISKTVDRSLQLITSKIKSKNVTIIKEIESINITTFENELIQVLLNIFNNAMDEFDNLNKHYIFIHTRKTTNNILIEIKDNAGGIPQDIISRIFEPYFTTKHKAQGTGIGLYMSNEIITKHLDGSINVTNKSYQYDNISCNGASFTIKIPLQTK